MISGVDLRLPGILFEAPRAAVRDDLPRMDVALFVGFAASGPLHVPVAIEQAAEFDAVFGRDIDLAWDLERGEMIRGQLGPAVRAFFRNGGRRCWIVRVAGPTRTTQFPLPRLACVTLSAGAPPQLGQAIARARSGGSWADGLEAATEIERQALQLDSRCTIHASATALAVDVVPGPELQTGDVVRVAFGDDVAAVGAVAASAIAPERQQLSLHPVQWLRRVEELPSVAFATYADAYGVSITRGAMPGPRVSERPLRATIDLDDESADPLQPGAFMQATGSGRVWVMSVESAGRVDEGSPPPRLRVRGPAWEWLAGPPVLPAPSSAERLRLALVVRRQDHEPVRVTDRGLSSLHARYWGRLPDDEELFTPMAVAPQPPGQARPVIVPRFPLAGSRGAAGAIELCVPLSDSPLPDFLGPFRSRESAQTRDGLEVFDAAVFLDRRLADAGAATLAARAEFVRYQSAPHPQRLDGIYAGFFIDEVSLAAIPDAIHRTWRAAQWTQADGAPPPLEPAAVKAPCAPDGPFAECHPCRLDPPASIHITQSGGRIHLVWPADPADAARITIYTVEEAVLVGASFTRWAIVGEGRANELSVYGRPPGQYLYRVKASRGGLGSASSAPQLVVIAPIEHAVTDKTVPEGASLAVLHRALMRMCAARGDCLAILSLPERYREDEAIAHARALASAADQGALSYAAVYHPWLFASEDAGAAARRIPPDGAACGLLARRALGRGAWVAPANEPLSGVVALTPTFAAGRRLDLQRARLNVVRQEPRGFVVLNEDTLSADPELRRINVRRLMILLRRRALQVGARYVFEPNDDRFRRLIQRAFESTLADLHARGAFAGATAASAFQVLVESRLNTPQARDAGRVFVELKVAPTQPLTFLTVRLVQRGDQLQAEER